MPPMDSDEGINSNECGNSIYIYFNENDKCISIEYQEYGKV